MQTHQPAHADDDVNQFDATNNSFYDPNGGFQNTLDTSIDAGGFTTFFNNNQGGDMNTSFGEAGFLVDTDRGRDRPAFDYPKKERRDSIGKHLVPEGRGEGITKSDSTEQAKDRSNSFEDEDLHNTSKNNELQHEMKEQKYRSSMILEPILETEKEYID